ncbi:ribosome maturation factor RimM [Tessaracoccus sp. OS52]|uniref:ribosome maturation factor RimM n=1 Tax=Tessaracoccus sp. OS52 TaxID=2886691 RepID=UPI001D126D93|nr:ribosome maturation factor RimM [Tessaracoccus sp. OS52]MCC2593244.1 ribosome maturation factor RimM [Tessaracoccus sp. OS52]
MGDVVEVIVGRVGRAHGIKGAVAIDLRTDEPGRRFIPGARLRRSGGGEVEIETVTWQRGRLQVTFVGYPDRTAVEALRGEELLTDVPADERPSEPEEYFDRNLVGLRVLDADGVEVGLVSEVLHLPAQDVLQVDTPTGERLVPFVKAIVPSVDLVAGTVTLAPVEGLLEDLE